ncbi:MAG: HipA domain-containing protein [Pseudomonadales bacterium]|nr:HipA domain-containing protein [Pseudomonadales bacterium]
MTSNIQSLFVWIWLKGKTTPVVAGKLERINGLLSFTYGQSYLKRKDAIAIYTPELPLEQGRKLPENDMEMASSIRDCSPDAWGRRVILNRLYGEKYNVNLDPGLEDELTYLIESSSNRIGALDFQNSATQYIPRQAFGATIDELMNAADLVIAGTPLSEELGNALLHGTPIGGARPKATITNEDTQYIAKFTTSLDTYDVVKAEFIAMRLAKIVGINVAEVELLETMGRSILLVKRFDRIANGDEWERRNVVSALTLLSLPDSFARYASYEEIAANIREHFKNPKDNLKELFKRIVFNILVGNNDDHARNHAAFWDGQQLELTPAYDICPQGRSGEVSTQAIKIMGNESQSQLSLCVKAAKIYGISARQATEICEEQTRLIRENWHALCEEANLSEIDRRILWENQILNPYCFYP